MKRFTDTDKWKKEWIRSLPPEYKCLWFYIADNCDNAGIWQCDIGLASFQIGASLDFATASSLFSGKIEDIGDNKWWIVGFIPWQYPKGLVPGCKAHDHVLGLIDRHGIDRRRIGMPSLRRAPPQQPNQ